MTKLFVRLIKCTDLADKDLIGETDPYVKLELKQDNVFRDKDFGYQMSTKKQNDRNPIWNEDFWFANVPNDLDNMVLDCSIFDEDIGSRDDKCGKCKIDLEKEDLSSECKRITKTISRSILHNNSKIYLEVALVDE